MRVERYFITGLAVLLPLFVTVWLVAWFYAEALRLVTGVLALFGIAVPGWLAPWLPVFGLGLAVLFITGVGLLASNWLGRNLVRFFDQLVSLIPLVRDIYRAVKQISTGLFGRPEMEFSRAALIEYPRRGSYALCFVVQNVGRRLSPLPEGYTVVVVPTSPVPASGFVLIVPNEEIIPLDIRVDDALRFVVSVGFILPPEEASRLAGRPI